MADLRASRPRRRRLAITPAAEPVDVGLGGLDPGPAARPFRRPRARPRWRLPAGVIAWSRSGKLDRQLATGVNPLTSGALAIRARRVTGRRSRRRVAAGLARVLEAAHNTRPVLTAAIPPDVREVLAARAVLVVLDRRLRASERVSPRGMAMLQLLLTEPRSPLYHAAGPGALEEQLRAAAFALEPTDPQETS